MYARCLKKFSKNIVKISLLQDTQKKLTRV